MIIRDETELREAIRAVIADWIVPGIPPGVIAQNIVDELGLEVQTNIKTYPAPGAEKFEDATITSEDGGWHAELNGLDITGEYREWLNQLPRHYRIVSPDMMEER